MVHRHALTAIDVPAHGGLGPSEVDMSPPVPVPGERQLISPPGVWQRRSACESNIEESRAAGVPASGVAA